MKFDRRGLQYAAVFFEVFAVTGFCRDEKCFGIIYTEALSSVEPIDTVIVTDFAASPAGRLGEFSLLANRIIGCLYELFFI